jgi:hypothetical protein
MGGCGPWVCGVLGWVLSMSGCHPLVGVIHGGCDPRLRTTPAFLMSNKS